MKTLDKDPWGRPYQIVSNKLRSSAPLVTESLHPRLLEDVVSTLFLLREVGVDPPEESVEVEWTDDMVVTEEKIAGTLHRLGAKNTAPGPDDIPSRE